jgi:hypothetical protein
MKAMHPFLMSSVLVTALVSAALTGAVAAAPEKEKPAARSENPAWRAKMQSMSATLSVLLPDLYDDSRFNDPKQRKAIEKNAQRLADSAHELRAKEGMTVDKDPTMRWMSKSFADDANYAVGLLKSGNREYARSILKNVTGYCIACHTRMDDGFQFKASLDSKAFKNLSSLDRAAFATSLRDYDLALSQYESVIGDSKEGRIMEVEKAFQRGVTLLVRVRKDPSKTLAFIDAFLKRSDLPEYLRERAKRWRSDVEAWKKEEAKRDSSKLAGKALLDEARKLTARAQAAQFAPVDRSADVLFLRASALLHQYLSTGQTGVPAAEASYLLGTQYDVLENSSSMRGFNEFYFQTCMVEAPHTPIARKCYQSYEESVYFGYTGSGGTFVPADVRRRLERFEALAGEKPKAEPSSRAPL